MHNMGFKNSRRSFVVLFGAFLLLFANMGLSLSGIPLFYRPVPEALGFTQTAFNATQTVSGLVGMVITPFAGVFIQKHFRKNQLLMLIAAVLTFLAFLAMSCATRLWEFYIASGVRGVTGVFIGGIAITMMVNNCFLKSAPWQYPQPMWARAWEAYSIQSCSLGQLRNTDGRRGISGRE